MIYLHCHLGAFLEARLLQEENRNGLLLGEPELDQVSITELVEGDGPLSLVAVQAVEKNGQRVAGWFRSVKPGEQPISLAEREMWCELFPEPWQLALVVQHSLHGPPQLRPFWLTRDGVRIGRIVNAQPLPVAPATEAPPQFGKTSSSSASDELERAVFQVSASYREALASLEWAILGRRGYAMVVGRAGMGRSILLRQLVERLNAAGAQVQVWYAIPHTVDAFYQMLRDSFELAEAGTGKVAVLSSLQRQLRHGSRLTALIVDNAHELPDDILVEIELLSNLETRRGTPLQLVLSGRPEIEQRLRSPKLLGLNQRMVFRPRLEGFSDPETAEYVRMQLQLQPSDVMAEEIRRLTRGSPERLAALCHQLLAGGRQEQVTWADFRAAASAFGSPGE